MKFWDKRSKQNDAEKDGVIEWEEMILKGLPRGVPKSDEEELAQSCWTDPEDIVSNNDLLYDPQNPDGKLFLGAINDQLIGIDDDRHMLTVAGSRAGKGTSVIIPNLLFYTGSMLVIDPKAELASITAERRSALGQTVKVLDPFNRAAPWVKDYKASFNPLTILSEDSPTLIEDAGLIADALVIAAGKDPHWDESAKTFIGGVILHVATFQKYKEVANLVTVRELITIGAGHEDETEFEPPCDDMGLSGLCNEMYNNDAAEGEIKVAAADFFERTHNEKLSVLSTARRHLTFLQYKAMREVLSGHDFNLTDLKNEEKCLTIYLCLPAGRLSTCNRWLRLFINLVLEAMERVPQKPRYPVILCLDEFAVLGHMEQIEKAAGQIAGYGVKLWPILQDLPQLKSMYKDRWETFLGNAGVLQFFGNNDVTTLEYIEKRAGKTSLSVEQNSDVDPIARVNTAATGKSWSKQVHPLITSEEASRYFSRSDPLARQVVFVPGENPAILQRVNYFDETSPFYKYFKDKYKVWNASQQREIS